VRFSAVFFKMFWGINSMPDIKEVVENFVAEMLRDYEPLPYDAPKVIHDTILGSNLFYPHEIALLDSPLLQRLRRISQVAVAPLVFPSGNHNRFEHTLGVTVIGQQLVNSLFQKIDKGNSKEITAFKELGKTKEYIENHVRIAAIMHDCGHGPFSHVSERYYKYYEDILQEKQTNRHLGGAACHEILSYLIIRSNTFREFFQTKIEDVYHINVNLDLVSEMIVGHISNPMLAFLVEMINGAFDADKLDYIQRDSHFTGIKMVLDLPRLFYTVDLIFDSDHNLRLSVDMSGVTTLEQIIFNKMMLFSTIYHHQKIRSAECLVISIFQELGVNKIKINDIVLDSAAKFLFLTDDDIYSLAKQKMGLVSTFAKDLCLRVLPKRALVISPKTMDSDNIDAIMGMCERPDDIMLIREAIAEETENMGSPISVNAIWVDIPHTPNFKEGILWPIKSSSEPLGFLTLRQVFPVTDWVKAFSQNKWKGYIFTKPSAREVVCEAARRVLSNSYQISINGVSDSICKLNQPS
jgi:HD superfamily phosphohydrolase